MIKIVFDKQALQWYNIPRNQNDFKDSQKEKTVRAFLAMCLFMPLTMSSVVAEEKMEFDFKLNDQGKWCGKFYSNRWSNNLRYQCKFQDEWERLGVTFPDTVREFKRVVIGEPILGNDATIRG